MTTQTDDGFWPDPPRATERYAATRPAPAWPARADLALVALTCAARDQLAYTRACALACRVFDREPTPPPKARWFTADWAKERVAQVEMRTVTRFLSGCLPTADALAKCVYRGRRSDAPLTWGEWHLLDCYGRKDAGAPNRFKQPAPLGTVLCGMDRPADDAIVAASRGGSPVMEIGYGGPRYDNPWADTAAALLVALVATEKQPSGTVAAWETLLKHLWGNGRV